MNQDKAARGKPRDSRGLPGISYDIPQTFGSYLNLE
jgi:hypothetical protein